MKALNLKSFGEGTKVASLHLIALLIRWCRLWVVGIA
jgi:hypothetical protein